MRTSPVNHAVLLSDAGFKFKGAESSSIGSGAFSKAIESLSHAVNDAMQKTATMLLKEAERENLKCFINSFLGTETAQFPKKKMAFYTKGCTKVSGLTALKTDEPSQNIKFQWLFSSAALLNK